MRRETAFQIIGRADVNAAVAQLEEINIPHDMISLPALLRSFGRSPYASYLAGRSTTLSCHSGRRQQRVYARLRRPMARTRWARPANGHEALFSSLLGMACHPKPEA